MINNKSWFSSASKFEKIFWGTILFFLFIFILLHFFASREYYQSRNNQKPKEEIVEPKKPKTRTIFKEIEVIVDSDKMRQNLENNETLQHIVKDLQTKIEDTKKNINLESKKLFETAHKNIDAFLDFHYSVIGEYIELGSMATGKMEEHIQQRLFGNSFSIEMQKMLQRISENHKKNIQSHLDVIGSYANKGVDPSLNTQAIARLKEDIHHHILLQQGKIGTLIIATLATKISKVVATKLAAKQASIIASKVGAKAGMKSAAAATGATAGVACGPLVWLCSPIAAATLWFGTDAVVVSVDEHLHRATFKQEIISALNNQQNRLSNKLSNHYEESIKEFSTNAQQSYKETTTKEKKRVKIKELITQ